MEMSEKELKEIAELYRDYNLEREHKQKIIKSYTNTIMAILEVCSEETISKINDCLEQEEKIQPSPIGIVS